MSEYMGRRSLKEQFAGTMFEEPAVQPLVVKLHHDIATSQAEEARQQKKVRGQAKAIVDFLREFGPHTRVELADKLGIRINSICPAVVALRDAGKILEMDGEDDRPLRRRGGGNLLTVTP